MSGGDGKATGCRPAPPPEITSVGGVGATGVSTRSSPRNHVGRRRGSDRGVDPLLPPKSRRTAAREQRGVDPLLPPEITSGGGVGATGCRPAPPPEITSGGGAGATGCRPAPPPRNHVGRRRGSDRGVDPLLPRNHVGRRRGSDRGCRPAPPPKSRRTAARGRTSTQLFFAYFLFTAKRK